MKQITLAISEAKSVQSSQWEHCIYEIWWDNNYCSLKLWFHYEVWHSFGWKNWWRVTPWGVSGDEEVSKTTSLPQREVKFWPSSHRSGTLHEARALRLHHCFDKIIEQFWSIWQNKYRWYFFLGIDAEPFLKKMSCHIDWKSSQMKGQYPPDRTKSRETHCFWVEWAHKSSVLLNASKQKVQDKATACNQWYGNFKEVPPGPTVSVKIFTRGYWHMFLEGVSRDDPYPSHNL